VTIDTGTMMYRQSARKDPRISVEGSALWSAGRVEGSCELRNLSAGGAEISRAHAVMRVGDRMLVTLLIGSLRFESVRVEVVRTGGDGLGLRFLEPSPEMRAQIEALVRNLLSEV
jgi:hypothetical protein